MRKSDNDYVIWAYDRVPKACVIKEFRGVKNIWELNKGIPRADNFPLNASFRMDPERPDDNLLIDNLRNIELLIVGSLKLKNFLESRRLKKIEYLPVTILDQKGKVASHDYFIINPIEPVECLDLKKSGAGFSRIDKTQVARVQQLVIDKSRLDMNREMFRPKDFHKITLVRRDLAKAIDKAKFTGITWVEIQDYNSLFFVKV